MRAGPIIPASRRQKKAKKKPKDDGINLGMPDEQRRAIAEGLSHLLADTCTLYLKTHNFHWNVTGQLFSVRKAGFDQGS